MFNHLSLNETALSKPPEMESKTFHLKVKNIIKGTRQSKQPFFIYLSYFTKAFKIFGENARKDKLRLISEMDLSVKKIVNHLKRYNQNKNTIIMFLSDNGARRIKGQLSDNYPLR